MGAPASTLYEGSEHQCPFLTNPRLQGLDNAKVARWPFGSICKQATVLTSSPDVPPTAQVLGSHRSEQECESAK